MKNIFNKHKRILSLILALSMVASAFTSSYISSHADEKIMDSISGKTAESVREEVRETQGNTEDNEAGGEIPDASIDSISEVSDIENTDNKKDSDDDGKNSDDSENKDDIDSGNSKESVDDKESGDNKVSPERNESGDTYESGEDKGSEVSVNNVNNVNNEATVTDNLEKSDKEKEPDKNSDSSENTEEPEAGDNPGITDYSADAIIMNDVANASEKYEISGNKNDSDKTNKKGEKKDQNDDETAPTFDRLYDGVSTAGLNFSGRELLIATSDPAVFTADTEVVSEYKGVYLTRYKDAAQCESAYTYYFNKVSFIDVNSSVKAMSGEADLTNLNNESDSISNINDMTPVNCSGCIALIDSGAAGKNVMKSVSVLGGSAGDDNGHGTMMAASISAANPGARILSIKALNSSATGKVADIYAAIQYAIASNVSIINMSLCSQISADSDILRNAISQARERGIHVVAAAGNNGKDASYYVPAGIPGVTTIGACDARGLREGVSNFGSCVDYYVFADSTSIASARFSGYLLADGPNKVIEREDVFTREMVETAREYASETDAEEYATETDAPAAGDDDIVIKGTYINATKEFPYAINARCTVNCAPYTIDPATNSVHGHYYNYVGAPYNPVLVSIVDSGYSKSDYKNFSCKETRCNSPGKAIPFQSNSVNTISGQVYLTSVVKNPDGSKTATYTSEYFQGGYVPVASGGQYIRVTFTMDYEKKPAFAGVHKQLTERIVNSDGSVSYSKKNLGNVWFDVLKKSGSSFTHVGYLKTNSSGVANEIIDIKGNKINSDGSCDSLDDGDIIVIKEMGIKSGKAGNDYSDCTFSLPKTTSGLSVIDSISDGTNVKASSPSGLKYTLASGYIKAIETTATSSKSSAPPLMSNQDEEHKCIAFQKLDAVTGQPITDGYAYAGARFYVVAAKSPVDVQALQGAAYNYVLDSSGNVIINLVVNGNIPASAGATILVNPDNVAAALNGSSVWAMDVSAQYSAGYKYFYIVETVAPFGYQLLNPDGTYTGRSTANSSPNGGHPIANVLTLNIDDFVPGYADTITYQPFWQMKKLYYLNISKKSERLNRLMPGVYFKCIESNGPGVNVGDMLVTDGNGNATVSLGYLPSYQHYTYKFQEYEQTAASYPEIWYYKDKNGNYINQNTVLTLEVYTDGYSEKYLNTYNFYNQTTSVTAYNYEEISVHLKKKSSRPEYTDGNPNYSLKGASYCLFETAEAAKQAAASNDYSGAINLQYMKEINGVRAAVDSKEIVVDENGDSQIYNICTDFEKVNNQYPQKKVFAVEKSPGEKGYMKSDKIYPLILRDDNTYTNPANIVVSDVPVMNPLQVVIKKVDAETGSEEGIGDGLEGAEFRLNFYGADTSVMHTSYELKNEYQNALKNEYSETVSTTKQSDGSYKAVLGAGKDFPLGFVTLEETKAPAGYKNKDYKIYIETKNGLVDISDNPVFVSAAERSGDGKSFKHLIYHPGNATTYGELETKGISVIKDENDPEVRMIFEDPEIRGNVQLTKRIEKQDDEGNDIPLANVKFKIESLSSDGSTLETHFIFTDEKGHVSTRQDLILEAEEYMKYVNHYDLVDDYDGTPSVIWFDGTKSDSNPPSAEKSGRGALPFGKYRITEMRCKANKGRQLEEPVTFEISEENQLVNVFDKNAEASDEKITNVPQPELSTTAVVKDTDLKVLIQDYKNQTIIDTVTCKNLMAGRDYTLLTELMIVDEEGNISPYMEGDKEYKRIENFSTELSYSRSRFEKQSTVEVSLENIDPTGIRKKHFVVYETLYADKYETLEELEKAVKDDTIRRTYEGYDDESQMDFFPLEHKDPGDSFQTVNPADIHTTAMDTVTNDQVAYPSEKITISDRVFYEGLEPGKSYTIKGTLHIKETGEVYKDADGKPLEVEKSFTPEKEEGYEDLQFVISAASLRGKSIVAFEELSYKDITLVVHADINDGNQTVHFPEMKTTTWSMTVPKTWDGKPVINDETAKQLPGVNDISKTQFTDTISYHNLLKNRTYMVCGKLMNKSTGEVIKDAAGKEITALDYFTTGNSQVEGDALDGSFDLLFKGYDVSNLDNVTGVVFEELYLVEKKNQEDRSKLIAEHKDINDVDQFIYFVSVHTKARDKTTDSQVAPQDTDTVIEDTVTYSNLIPGKTYKLTATLHVKNDTTGNYKDGDMLLGVDGNPVKMLLEFVPEKADGEIKIDIPFNTSNLNKMEVVVFEDLYNSYDMLVGCHNDLEDKNQMIAIPEKHKELYINLSENTPNPKVDAFVSKPTLLGVPKTGSVFILYVMALMLISGGGIAFVIRRKRIRKVKGA